MTKDKANQKSAEGARSGDTFTWDPRADQVFTPEDSTHNTPLVGKAESFDKEAGYSFTATGGASIGADHGTTTWGGGDPAPNGKVTVIETRAPEGLIFFSSYGSLVIGSEKPDPSSYTKLLINHGRNDTDFPGLGLDVPDLKFSGVTVEIDNKSALHAGVNFFKVSTVTLNDTTISVRNGSVCRITPNLDARRITVRGLVGLRVSEGSSAYMGGATWDFSKDSTMLFFLDGIRDGNTGADSRSYCYLSGFDFLSSSYYGVKFDFTTKDDDGRPLKNNGEYVFAGIGDAFQLTAMFEKQLITIDGVPADFRNIADDFTGGDLRIRVK